jgi:Domain of Unknown Function (DUF1080)
MFRKIISALSLFLILSAPTLRAQVSETLKAFPYQKASDVGPQLQAMRSWSASDWSEVLRLLDIDSLKLSPAYALDAYVNSVAKDPVQRTSAAKTLSKGLSGLNSFFARNLVIQCLGRLGEDAAVPALAKTLRSDKNVGDAARALSVIGSDKALKALEKAAPQASGAAKAEIDAALEHIRKTIARNTPSFTLSKQERKAGFEVLFDGRNLDKWVGNKSAYPIREGAIMVDPHGGSGGGNLYTAAEYGDFEFRFEFQLTPGANNGLGIRTPTKGDAAYVGMELQILDNEAEKYKTLQPYQYHGSVYGVATAKRGFLKPTGEWNRQTVIAKGDQIKVILNDEVILDVNVREVSKNGTADKRPHPGLLNPKGHIGFLGHGDVVKFRNIRILKMD